MFLPVLGYEGRYEVSDQGVIQSINRQVLGRDGAIYPFKGRVLRPARHKDTGYLMVSLWKEGVGRHHYLHRLVAQAHIPNPLTLPEVNHCNGDRGDCRVINLEWVTGRQNKQHAIETGLRVYTNRLSEQELEDCLECVISGESFASLTERVPYKVPFLSTKLRAVARKLGIEEELNASLMIQRINRARINGAKHHRVD